MASNLGRRLLVEDEAQDLVEYALLVMFFGVLFLAVWTSVGEAVGTAYGNSTTGVQGLWDAPEPGGG